MSVEKIHMFNNDQFDKSLLITTNYNHCDGNQTLAVLKSSNITHIRPKQVDQLTLFSSIFAELDEFTESGRKQRQTRTPTLTRLIGQLS